MTPTRRTFLAGLGAALAAPAVIRTPGLLMPVRALPLRPSVVVVPWPAELATGTQLDRLATECGLRRAIGWAEGRWSKDILRVETDASLRQRIIDELNQPWSGAKVVNPAIDWARPPVLASAQSAA